MSLKDVRKGIKKLDEEIASLKKDLNNLIVFDENDYEEEELLTKRLMDKIKERNIITETLRKLLDEKKPRVCVKYEDYTSTREVIHNPCFYSKSVFAREKENTNSWYVKIPLHIRRRLGINRTNKNYKIIIVNKDEVDE